MAARRQIGLTRLPRNPKLSWNTYQRQVLCCLYRFFECSHVQLSVLFSQIFRSDLRHRGYGNSDVPYRKLHEHWTRLRRERHLVWYHVHVVTEFRADGEWKNIIHLIRLTAFELGILLSEKRTDTIIIPDGEFDVNEDPCEYLTSVLLTNPTRPRDSSSVDDTGHAWMQSSTEDTGAFDGSCAGDAQLDFSVPSAPPLIEGSSSDASRSTFSFFPETPTTEVNQPTPMSCTPFTFRDDTPTPQDPAIVDSALVDTHMNHSSNQGFGPLVTSHDKVCFWCEREGKSLYDSTTTAEPSVRVSDRESDNQWIVNLSKSPRLSVEDMAALDVNIEDPKHQDEFGDLPGLRGPDDLPNLLYRWHNTNSQGINSGMGLVAGWFTADYPDVGSPTQLSRRDFLNVFAAHVRRIQVPTPFISAFARPLAPIHRAMRNRQNAKISIINPRKLLTAVFHAQPLAIITETTVPQWKGYGEYAIWGYVPPEAIICNFEIAALEDIASCDHEIQHFLQLHLIEGQATCQRGLRLELRTNLQDYSYESSRSMLRRLALCLNIPEKYHEDFATDIYKAWTLDLGPANEDREGLEDHDTSPVPAVSDVVHTPNQVSQKNVRYSRESTTSFVPPKSDDGSCSESTSEADDDLSQSPEAPCPRRDTPSPAFSVASETDHSVQLNNHRSRARDVEMLEVAVLPTPPSTSRYFARSSNVNANANSAIPPLNLSRLSLSNSLNDDNYFSEGSEWPSDGETLPGTETPTKSRFFNRNGNEKESGRPLVPRLTLHGQNPFMLSDVGNAGL